MTKKDMITEYCLMYVDIYGKMPETKKLHDYSESDMEKTYLKLKTYYNKLNTLDDLE